MELFKEKKEIQPQNDWIDKIMNEYAASQTYYPIKKHLLNEFRKLKRKLWDIYWLFKVSCRFWVLEHILKNYPIRVYEHSQFNPDPETGWDGKVGYLDVSIALPGILNGTQFQWIFTVNNVDYMFMNQSYEDAHTQILYHKLTDKSHPDYKKFICMREKEFWTWLRKNANDLLDPPIVEFDEIWTNKEYFVQEDVIKYTWFWLKRHCPKLANREIIFVSWEDQKKEKYKYHGIYGKFVWLKHKIFVKSKGK